MGQEYGESVDERIGKPWEIWSTDREEQMQKLEDIGISRLEIILDYGSNPFNYPDNPVYMPKDKRKTIIKEYCGNTNEEEVEETEAVDSKDELKKTPEEIDAEQRKTFGMTIREAEENPQTVLDNIEALIANLEADKKEKQLSGKFKPVLSTELSLAMILASRVEDKIKEAGFEERYSGLKKRREVLKRAT